MQFPLVCNNSIRAFSASVGDIVTEGRRNGLLVGVKVCVGSDVSVGEGVIAGGAECNVGDGVSEISGVINSVTSVAVGVSITKSAEQPADDAPRRPDKQINMSIFFTGFLYQSLHSSFGCKNLLFALLGR